MCFESWLDFDWVSSVNWKIASTEIMRYLIIKMDGWMSKALECMYGMNVECIVVRICETHDPQFIFMNMSLIDNSTATRLHWGNDYFPSGCKDLKEG